MHICVWVIGPYVEQQLEPYDENLEVEPYTENVDLYYIDSFVEYYVPLLKDKCSLINKDKLILIAQQLYQKYGQQWNENMWSFYPDKNLVISTSTLNPKARWDYFNIGGRFCNSFITNSGDKVTNCLIKELDMSLITQYPGHVLIDSIWLTASDFQDTDSPYQSLASNAKNYNDFLKQVLLLNLEEEITVVDCHY
jgi:hypothetical protein